MTSDSPAEGDAELDELLIKDCYKGIAQGGKNSNKKECLAIDNQYFRCKNKIGAANYIGITYSIPDGYSQGSAKFS